MTLAEKIVALKPPVVTGVWLALIAIASLIAEAPLPLSAPLSWLGGLAFGVIGIIAMVAWPAALNAVALSRQVEAEPKKRASKTAFRIAAALMLVFSTVGSATVLLPEQALLAAMALSLLGSFFWLRALWLTANALVDFEGSTNTFRTFSDVFLFPVGVWSLHSRIDRLLSAPPLTAASLP